MCLHGLSILEPVHKFNGTSLESTLAISLLQLSREPLVDVPGTSSMEVVLTADSVVFLRLS